MQSDFRIPVEVDAIFAAINTRIELLRDFQVRWEADAHDLGFDKLAQYRCIMNPYRRDLNLALEVRDFLVLAPSGHKFDLDMHQARRLGLLGPSPVYESPNTTASIGGPRAGSEPMEDTSF